MLVVGQMLMTEAGEERNGGNPTADGLLRYAPTRQGPPQRVDDRTLGLVEFATNSGYRLTCKCGRDIPLNHATVLALDEFGEAWRWTRRLEV